MTSVLSCLVATLALGGEPDMKGLPFGIPPAPDDAVIANVAPPKCLVYVNWAGTAAPSPAGKSETEKMLAEPEVQELIGGLNKLFVGYLRHADEEEAKKTSAVAEAMRNVPPVTAAPASVAPAPGAPLIAENPYAKPVNGDTTKAAPAKTDVQVLPSPFDMRDWDDARYFPPGPQFPLSKEAAAQKAISADQAKESAAPPAPADSPVYDPPINVPQKPAFSVSAGDYGDLLGVLLTHPTAVFVSDVKYSPRDAKSADDDSPELHGGMVVKLGDDTERVVVMFMDYYSGATQAGEESQLDLVTIGGKNWYRTKPTRPSDKNLITFGFHDGYFVAGLGEGAVEGILARWNRPAPEWLSKAMRQTEVPRRTGIVYVNLKAIRELLPQTMSKGDLPGALAMLELCGLENADSLVSTTGLEEHGMVNRVVLTVDGQPHGLLDMISARPLTAKDIEPIPRDALLALAVRVDPDRAITDLAAAYRKGSAGADLDLTKAIAKLNRDSGLDLHRLLHSLGDEWCLYNSPGEGEFALCGWTLVVPVRDRAALLEGFKKLHVVQKGKAPESDGNATADLSDAPFALDSSTEFRKCHFAGHEIYYWAGQPISPAVCVTDREVVVTLNMPAMKAFLARKDHRSLASVASVKSALDGPDRPAALGYCDTPRMFDLCYPLFSLYAGMGTTAAQKMGIDLDPTFWPSATSIRPHLSPDVTTLRRRPHGLELTCRYCLPSGGVTSPLWLAAGYSAAIMSVYHGDPFLNGSPRFPPPSVSGPPAPPPPNLEPAEWNGLKGKKVAVVCKVHASLELDHETITTALSRAISERLKDSGYFAADSDRIHVIDAQRVADLIDDTGMDDYLKIGARLKADKVVGVDVESISVLEGQTLFQGHASVKIWVYDVASKKVEWRKRRHENDYPIDRPMPAENTPEANFRDKFIENLAERIARSFYPHDRTQYERREDSPPAPLFEPPPAKNGTNGASGAAQLPAKVSEPKASNVNAKSSAARKAPAASEGVDSPAKLDISADTSQVYFVGLEGLTIQWDVGAPGGFDSEKLVAPGRYNFPQGAVYRLKLRNIPGRPGVELFPTIEVAKSEPKSEGYLNANAIPVEFTDEDFDQVMTGISVTKVIYWPDDEFQEPALAGVGTLVSTRLDPGVDAITEAKHRGAIMAIVRLGPAPKAKERRSTE